MIPSMHRHILRTLTKDGKQERWYLYRPYWNKPVVTEIDSAQLEKDIIEARLKQGYGIRFPGYKHTKTMTV